MKPRIDLGFCSKIFFQKKKKGKKDVAYIKYQYMQIFEETSLT